MPFALHKSSLRLLIKKISFAEVKVVTIESAAVVR
jgi:hypothetical protein